MNSLISSTSTCIFHYMLLYLFFTSPLLHLHRCFFSSLFIQTPSLLTYSTSLLLHHPSSSIQPSPIIVTSTNTRHRHFSHHPSSLFNIVQDPKLQFLSTFKLQTFIRLQFLSTFKLQAIINSIFNLE